MKRLLVLMVLSLMAVFLMTSLAVGATGTAKSSTKSKVSPKRDKKRPYKFKVSGSVKFPLSYCAPNAAKSSCIAITCPAGTTNPNYCTKPGIGAICTGKVKVVFKSKHSTVSKSIKLRSNCTYKKTVTVKKKGKYTVTAKFGGNTVLKSSKASKKHVRAG